MISKVCEGFNSGVLNEMKNSAFKFCLNYNYKSMENKNLLIDTHAHINFNDFKDDSKDIVKRALNENIWMINVGAESKTSERAIKIAGEYAEGVYAAVGLHPNHLIEQNVEYKDNGELIKYKSKPQEFNYDFYLNLAKNKKVVGIGECGLDFHMIENQTNENPASPTGRLKVESIKEKQKEVFIKHLELAKEVNKPIIIHCRDAHDDLLKILHLAVKPPSGAMHFFTGNLEQAKEYIELGFYISFSGVITFTNSYDEAIKNIPLEKILIETDCPYVAPIPHRGKRNEPAYVKYVAHKIAEVRCISFEEVAEQTTKNAWQLFKIQG